ncbi:uncharacterized protein LOC111912993 [Lactuca sativa]|uniref:uncharacterized protein LOC111912993 n=1 Tax=Lactuca sativa TaxID=4236 RepID=UPI000CB7C955|nr:uncharacterized protein LOC111912993 [Lactuca sativa]
MLMSSKTLTHFMHPSHQLTEHIADTIYRCDGCKMYGTGTRFTCPPCNFDLHDYCAKCPPSLPLTVNHPHPMSLVDYKPQLNHTEPCKICRSPIQGLAYMCKNCDYWIHPPCVLHYLGLRYFIHPSHNLTEFTANTDYVCNGCYFIGTGKRFTCSPCNYDLHEYCANSPTWLHSTQIHHHPLSLFIDKHQLDKTKFCQICRTAIQGFAYECKGCNFWVHSLCALHNIVHGHGGQSSIFNQGQSYTQQGSFQVSQPMRPQTVPTNWISNGASSYSPHTTGGEVGDGNSLYELLNIIQCFFESIFLS